MERNGLFKAIDEYLKPKMKEAYNLDESTILSHIGITSVEFVMLLVFVENEFGITFEDDDLLMSNDITLGAFVNRIMELGE